MTPSSIVDVLAWLICGIYATIPAFWLLIHPFADFWRARFRAPLKVLAPIWVAMWCIAWLATSRWMHLGFSLGGWYAALAAPFWAVSVFVYFGGKRHFTLTQVIGRTELEADREPQTLVTTGLHAHLRHPLYLAHLCTMLGWLMLARTQAVLGLLVFAVVSGTLMLRAEDAELERRFGEPYRIYKKRVPAVLPKW